MYRLAIIVQIISILFCATGSYLLFSRISKTVSKNLLASSLFAMIFGVGYLMEMMATNEGEALYALITQYIGLSFVALFFAIYTTELFQYFKMPKMVWSLIFLFNLATFVAVLTSEYHGLYYLDMAFVDEGLYPHLVTKNSPWFYTFMIILLGQLIYSAIFYIQAMVLSFRKKFNIWSLLGIVCSVGFMWFSFSVGFNGYEPISAIVCITLGVTSLIMMNSRSSAIVNQAYAESYMNSAIGQVIITRDKRFLECNKKACEFYPQFSHYQSGQPVKIEGEGIVFNEDDNRLYVGDNCYAITYHDLGGNAKSREGQIISMTDVTALERQRIRDGLTGLYNRQAYFEMVNVILAGKPERIDVLMADLNGLKPVNDNFGHAEGDSLLISAATCLKNTFNEDSYVFRMGGDEFAVISVAGEKKFEEMLIKLANAVDAANRKRKHLVSLSCGTASGSPEEVMGFARLIKAADKDMYLNKRKYYEVNHIERRQSQEIRS